MVSQWFAAVNAWVISRRSLRGLAVSQLQSHNIASRVSSQLEVIVRGYQRLLFKKVKSQSSVRLPPASIVLQQRRRGSRGS